MQRTKTEAYLVLQAPEKVPRFVDMPTSTSQPAIVALRGSARFPISREAYLSTFDGTPTQLTSDAPGDKKPLDIVLERLKSSPATSITPRSLKSDVFTALKQTNDELYLARGVALGFAAAMTDQKESLLQMHNASMKAAADREILAKAKRDQRETERDAREEKARAERERANQVFADTMLRKSSDNLILQCSCVAMPRPKCKAGLGTFWYSFYNISLQDWNVQSWIGDTLELILRHVFAGFAQGGGGARGAGPFTTPSTERGPDVQGPGSGT
jgi:hypothetical protein